MAGEPPEHFPAGALHEFASLGGRAAAYPFKPLGAAMRTAVGIGANLERRGVDHMLDSGELERILGAVLSSSRFGAAFARALESETASRLVDSFFASGLLDRVIDRLLADEALWRLIDEIAGSPAVMAAISQQGRGFADQVGGEVRAGSRKADDWLERAARRLRDRQPRPSPTQLDPDPTT